ncbi:GntR family transcriptional regulator [Streptomyces sp. NPDC090052]|uniref:GntR family transcriptional regulator n=1 Tax=unclassified Streptomyces TaxID=2593676 RepID=UPI00224ED961|nr:MULTISPECIES: GntR family transcriptional regulator [unclassified Streptomyces]MCX4724906.1 GntR family transcriptional regulator [Streptomyces sp. NBC_01306]WSV05622.1 GntR family transcriptional regulator [Streptomyces sp. NBC_01020]WSX43703.1 GntR family transcriptional regulator [Streptomyces sp. NBC_00963]
MTGTAVTVDGFLAEPMTVSVGQPLRVAVYSRLAQGIRDQVFPLGSALPKEADLGTRLGVSRTVVREALMLLEEDGLIRTRRGVGRFVSQTLPRQGLEQLQPFEETLTTPEQPVRAERLEMNLQRTTDFVLQGLGLEEGSNAWFCETRLTRGTEQLALVQEHIACGSELRALSPVVADRVQELHDSPRTLLGAMTGILGPVFGPGECTITAGIAGATRGRLLGLRPTDPLLIITQTAQLGGKPAYLAKYLVAPTGDPLSILQPPQPGAAPARP